MVGIDNTQSPDDLAQYKIFTCHYSVQQSSSSGIYPTLKSGTSKAKKEKKLNGILVVHVVCMPFIVFFSFLCVCVKFF